MTGGPRPRAGSDGVVIIGAGPVTISDSAIGHGAHVGYQAAPSTDQERGQRARWDVGVITVLSEETQAVADMLRRAGDCREVQRPGGLRFDEAIVERASPPIRIVATQALDKGPLSAGHAFGSLLHYYDPHVVALTGIAAAIHPSVALGDVVIAHDVIYYDHRKETPAGLRRRGASHSVTAPVRRAINKFFSDHGEPCRLATTDPDGISREFRVLPGPIGSGGAVVADENSAIRAYLASYNDKTLALETEATGLAQAFYEKASGNTEKHGWLVIRGISDYANPAKDDTWHQIASWHAATVLELLAPYLS